MSSQTVPPDEVWYEIQVASRINVDDPSHEDWPHDYYDDQLNELIEHDTWRYNQAVEQLTELADAHDEAVFEAPAYLLDKIATVSAQVRALERYRDRLIAFARSYAVDPESMRVIANATGLSHTTIMRIADDDAIRAVASPARDIATSMLRRLDPHEDPELFARLSKIVNDTNRALTP